MTRDEKIAEARRLRAAGLTLAQIANRLGYAQPASAWALLHPDETRARRARDNARRAPARRAWENEHDRGVCACGATMAVGTRRRGFEVCRDCYEETMAVGTAMRCERIAELWSRGLTQREIAAELHSTPSSINTTMARMRRSGWDLPRRYNWTPEGLERAQAGKRAA